MVYKMMISAVEKIEQSKSLGVKGWGGRLQFK